MQRKVHFWRMKAGSKRTIFTRQATATIEAETREAFITKVDQLLETNNMDTAHIVARSRQEVKVR